MNNQDFSKIWIWIIVILAIIIGGAILIYQKASPVVALNESNPWLFIPVGDDYMVIHEGQSGVVEYKEGTKIQVNGFNLGKVEFWATPAESGEDVPIGTAVKREKAYLEEKGESWLFAFPSDQTVSNLLAIAFDSKGNEVGRINFPYFENVTKEEREKVANWETYKNEEYGYEIKYSPSYSKVYEADQMKEITIGNPVMFYYRISIKENVSSLNELRSLMQEPIEKLTLPDLEITWKDTIVSGKKAIEMSYENFAGGYTGITHQTGVIKDSTAYIIILINGSEIEYYQMLSTLRFIGTKKEEPYIKVISPNGGEKWIIEDTYEIKWNSSGIEKVNIVLENWETPEAGWPTSGGMAENIPANLGKYSFSMSLESLPPALRQPNNYFKIRIVKSDYNYSISDRSDEFFSIVEPVGTSDWKTYKNEEYGFEFKYSPSLIANTSFQGIPFFGNEKTLFFLIGRHNVIDFSFRVSMFKGSLELLQNSINDYKEQLREIYVQLEKKEPQFGESTITIGGKSGFVFVDKNDFNAEFFYIPLDNQNVLLIGKGEEGENGNYESISNEMLSTFRFLE